MLSLHNLEKSKSGDKSKVRRGRGNASGRGNYSGRGMKGQRARSGGKSGLALRSIKGYLLRIPKVRGFKSLNKDIATVNLGELNEKFNEGDTVNIRSLFKMGLIKDITKGLKILSDGKITKKLRVEANAFSAKAKEKLEKAGGTAVVVNQTKKEESQDKEGKKENTSDQDTKESKNKTEK